MNWPCVSSSGMRVVWLAAVFCAVLSGGQSPAEQPLRDVIDEQIRSAWQRENVQPAANADDAEFLRRVYLDLVGVIPTYDEALAFLDDPTSEKRSVLIDRLLANPRFARHQSEVWDMVLFGRNPPGYDTDKRDDFRNWLRDRFADNTPYDQWVRQILRAEGNTVDNGAPMYYVQYKSRPEDATEAITQTFLGVQLQCARCHDHPFEDWSQLDFYGMAAFLARLDVVSVGKKNKLTMYAVAEKSSGDILFTGPASQQEPGKKGAPVKPKFLLGDELQEPPLPAGFKEVKFESNKPPPKPLNSRKDQLAEWIASAENPFFARAAANRLWAQFMGRGVVHPVDNLSEFNSPSHPALLDALAAALVAHGFDLKWYVRELCNSRTYQLSSVGDGDEAMPHWFERARVRPLSAEELLDSWRVAVGYDAMQAAAGKQPKERYEPLGSGYLLQFFGKPNNGVGDFQGGLHEHLYMNNGGLGQLFTTAKGSLHETLLGSSDLWEQRVERLYLSVLSRRATEDEQAKFVEFLSAEERPHDRLQQAIWVLMTCSEFRFNH